MFSIKCAGYYSASFVAPHTFFPPFVMWPESVAMPHTYLTPVHPLALDSAIYAPPHLRFVPKMGFLDIILGFLRQLQECDGSSSLGF